MPFFFIFDPILLFNGEFSVDFVIAKLSAVVGGIALESDWRGGCLIKFMVTKIILLIALFHMIDPETIRWNGCGLFLSLS